MRILVAGGAGYIGSRLVPSLIEHGYDVDVIDMLWFGNYLPPGVRLLQRDLFACQSSDFEGYEQVIFLAGISNDPMAEYDPAENFVQNGALPAYLAFTAKKARVRRFIYASSCSIYGYTQDELYDEDGPVACGYPYGISKLQGERAVLQMADREFSVIALRQGTVCGWSPRMRFDLIVNTMYKTAISSGVITVNNASIWRPILDIRDAASAFTRAVQASYGVSGVFNVASGNFTVGQVADYVKGEIEERTAQRVRMDILAINDFRNYKVSCERARVELGYQPQYSIRDIVADLHRHADSYGDFEGDQYYNVRTFKTLAGPRRQLSQWTLTAAAGGPAGMYNLYITQMRPSIQYAIDTLCQNFVEGWALGPSGLCTVEVVVDGRLVGQAVTGLSRSDVGTALPDIPGSAEAGFIYAFSEQDLSQSKGDASVWLRIKADGGTLETERMEIPAPERAGARPPLPRSCFPPTVTEVIIRRSPNLASGDLTSEAGTLAAVAVLEHLVRRGPRPLPGVHRYLGYLRAVFGSAIFAAQYFPRANVRRTGEKDSTAILTSPIELVAIAHHLFVLADAGIPGAVLEFGCYKGYSTSVLSTACHLLGRELHAFDSFKGLPSTDSMYYRPGEFAGDLEEVRRNIAEFGRPDIVKVYPGFFSESLPQWRPQPVMCLWMDVDLEQSAIDALRIFPNLDRRGALFSHECSPTSFAGGRPVPRRGTDDVVGPIVDAFSTVGSQAVGLFLSGNTGAFWDAQEGVPVLPPEPFERLLKLARQ